MNLVTATLYLLLQEMNMTANQGENESQNDSLIVQFSISGKNRHRLALYKIPPNPAIITGNFSCSLTSRSPGSRTHPGPRGWCTAARGSGRCRCSSSRPPRGTRARRAGTHSLGSEGWLPCKTLADRRNYLTLCKKSPLVLTAKQTKPSLLSFQSISVMQRCNPCSTQLFFFSTGSAPTDCSGQHKDYATI